MWEAVIKEYERAGSNFEEAYHQARLARILGKDEYCFKTNKPKLWIINMNTTEILTNKQAS